MISEISSKREAIAKLCDNIYAMARQAPHDFGGEQREFYIPKLQECLLAAGILFPAGMAVAMQIVDD